MTDKPTPKEIDDLVYELRQAGKDDTYSLASAVLAKWGTPATGGEPAGTVGYTVHGTQYVNWRTKPPAHGTPLYTTPQPTQAQAGAVPLTDEQIDRAIAELGLNYLADAHATNRAVLRKLCHHAHGIKGGQHG